MHKSCVVLEICYFYEFIWDFHNVYEAETRVEVGETHVGLRKKKGNGKKFKKTKLKTQRKKNPIAENFGRKPYDDQTLNTQKRASF